MNKVVEAFGLQELSRMTKRQVSDHREIRCYSHFKTSLISQILYQVLNFGMIVSSALMIWKGLMVVTGSESPIVVVLSGSMEPAFHRGDLLFLTNFREDPIKVGDIVVFKVEGRDIPIVHRVLKLHEKYKFMEDGSVKILTKGDNNSVDDRGLYAPGQLWLQKKDIVGRAKGFVPYVGIVTILMNDYPKFKYAVLGCLGIFVLVHRE
ncbi:signal peptidase complex catalytic subunit SEC11A-like protein [Leptotrombidium deliense]|uniref:Signal peptidase complex catalytic subunit SEC11 n=1 Tax=Leptotrombidium deliense TaxID=299467 RepID=A0A443S531_9ACAR|nr:signal peptidase complex catalytic subunit SEC11A-like protein [Leptotrombidium deliense]